MKLFLQWVTHCCDTIAHCCHTDLTEEKISSQLSEKQRQQIFAWAQRSRSRWKRNSKIGTAGKTLNFGLGVVRFHVVWILLIRHHCHQYFHYLNFLFSICCFSLHQSRFAYILLFTLAYLVWCIIDCLVSGYHYYCFFLNVIDISTITDGFICSFTIIQ